MEEAAYEFSFMDELLAEDTAQFAVTDDAQAEWAALRILHEERECERIIRTARATIARYERLIEDTMAKSRAQAAYLSSCLEAYFDTVPHKATKTQETYRLASTTLKRKKQNPEFKRDEKALLAWAKATDDEYVRTKEEPAWSEIKAVCTVNGSVLVHTETGEVVPGVVVEARPPVFFIEPVKGAQ